MALVGLWDRIIASVGRHLDSRVWGSNGVAQVSYGGLLDDRTLCVRAAIESGGRGQVVLEARAESNGTVHDRRDEGQDVLESELAPAGAYREAPVTVQADVVAAPGASDLAVLSVRIWQREPGQPAAAPIDLQSYSVESRVGDGRAQLRIVVKLTT